MKWISILHHVQNEHVWLTGRCEHEPLVGPPTDRDGNEIPYFKRDEQAMYALRKLVMERRWLESMKHYTKFRLVSVTIFCNVLVAARHTGMLEAFHSVILAYCSKRFAFQ